MLWKTLSSQVWKTYWKLTILKDNIKKWKYRYVLCLCDCWNKKEIRLTNIINWHTKSCWCLRKKSIIKHWMKWTRFYRIYYNMLNRCNNKNNKSYKWYWLKWINVEWECFEDFYKDMYDSYNKNLQIDRINNNWNYCKENCRWVSVSINNNNKSNNRIIEYKWNKKTLTERSRLFNINKNTLWWRIFRNWWSVEKSFNTK